MRPGLLGSLAYVRRRWSVNVPRRIVACALLLPAMALAAERWSNSLDMEFVTLPAGSFVMGNTDIDDALFEMQDGDATSIRDELPAHEVRIPRAFRLATTEVTQAQWLALMGTRPGPNAHWARPDWARLPVVSVSWNDAMRFIAALNQREPGRHYRLPSEVEWEYAARAGSTGLRPFPREALPAHAWYLDNSGDVPQPVATRTANAWGLHDMLGNAWEWVADRYDEDAYRKARDSTVRSPDGDADLRRVRRGGSYHCPPHWVRPGYRAADAPGTRYSVLGLRLALDLPTAE